ncbi:MAG TPA: hypothetical protein ENH10_10475 [Bacteroidetes bacterium]|nr:hypothetical protein BMS3Bbin04_01940 [bacterium BMS3Bbin04]HDO66432.1 hypothetical protein [Bacteroidota bacterium]HEX05557.1 hypothetical protein [Bacteroidota bacterium]
METSQPVLFHIKNGLMRTKHHLKRLNIFRYPAMCRMALPWLAGLFLTLAMVLPSQAQSHPRVGIVEAFWEDSLAIIRPEIIDPLDTSLRRTLESGVPVRVDVEIRFSRTGYVKTVSVGIIIEYDVWTGWYRVTTPLSPFAIKEYATVEQLFAQDLLLIFGPDEVDPHTEWFVKVRSGAVIHDGDEETGNQHGVANDLSGVTRLLFQLFDRNKDRGEWSELVKLSKREDSSP